MNNANQIVNKTEEAQILKQELLPEWLYHIFSSNKNFKKFTLKDLCEELDKTLWDLCVTRTFAENNRDFILKFEKITSEALG